MGKDKTTLTDCEQLVMKVIWNSSDELTLPEIVKAVNETYQKEWKPQTVSIMPFRTHILLSESCFRESLWKQND